MISIPPNLSSLIGKHLILSSVKQPNNAVVYFSMCLLSQCVFHVNKKDVLNPAVLLVFCLNML